MNLMEIIGLKPSARDQRLRELVTDSYSSVTVVGRGTVKIDPREVSASPEFQHARRQAEMIVKP